MKRRYHLTARVGSVGTDLIVGDTGKGGILLPFLYSLLRLRYMIINRSRDSHHHLKTAL
jgi:hypothetical protein